jgi:hypothetical protein
VISDGVLKRGVDSNELLLKLLVLSLQQGKSDLNHVHVHAGFGPMALAVAKTGTDCVLGRNLASIGPSPHRRGQKEVEVTVAKVAACNCVTGRSLKRKIINVL